MPQPLSTLRVDDLDDSTRPYTHSQIDDMRKLVASAKRPASGPAAPREHKVNLERFAHFGDAGTPAGMISSKGAVSGGVSGSCGTEAVPAQALARVPSQPVVPVEGPGVGGWGPPPDGVSAGGDADGVPVARVGVLEWGPTLVYGAAAPEPIHDELPTAKLELPPVEVAAPIVVVAHERSEPHQDADAPAPALASSKTWIIVIGGVLALGVLAGMFFVGGRGEPEPAGGVVEVVEAEPIRAVSEPEPEPKQVRPPERGEDVLVDELERPEAEPEAEPEPKPEPKPKPGRKTPPYETKDCAIIRAQASDASRAGAWNEVVARTGKNKCWSKADKVDFMRIRMTALFELGRSDECVKVGKGSNHPRIVTLRKRCTLAQK